MEITYFVLGALSVITIVSVVGVVRIRVEMKKMVNDQILKTENVLSEKIYYEFSERSKELDKLHTLI